MLKYQLWYNQIVDRARDRDIPSCYCEWHHVLPRSLGGGDSPSNLVLLTYREHFLVHWLLTKFTDRFDLRKMQRAMFAMTMQRCGNRIISGWQFEAAKRAIRDLELDPVAQIAWQKAYLAQKAEKKLREWDLQAFARLGRIREREENFALVERAINSGKLGRDSLCGAASLLLRHNGKTKKGRYKGQGLSAAEVNVRVARTWRTIRSEPTAKKAKRKLEAALNV